MNYISDFWKIAKRECHRGKQRAVEKVTQSACHIKIAATTKVELPREIKNLET